MGRKPICDLGKPLRVGLIGAGGMADYHVAGFKKAGAEVVQLYVAEKNPSVLRPKKELKAFKKVFLAPGEKQVVTFDLQHSALAFWNDKTHAWQVNPGEYTISLGTSSAHIVAELPIQAK